MNERSLLRLATAYADHIGQTVSTVSTRIAGSGDVFSRLGTGSTITNPTGEPDRQAILGCVAGGPLVARRHRTPATQLPQFSILVWLGGGNGVDRSRWPLTGERELMCRFAK